MIPALPFYIVITFIVTTLVTAWFLYKAGIKSTIIWVILLIWLIIQALLSFRSFYQITDTMPPRLAMMAGPPVLFIILLFLTHKGRIFVDKLNVEALTWLHIIRVPVEIVLLWLFLQGQVPRIMTFEGWNFDIISGITAPVIAWLGFQKRKLGKPMMVAWNIICLGLLVNIVTIAILSSPVQFQQLAFEQPNVAILYFPFVWLPAFVVPAVLFSHLASLKHLLKKGNSLR
jgi:hypothetical protein